jgi:hypothetical protein
MFRAVLVVFVLFGLNPGSLAQDPNDKMDKILITLERTRCFGRCPIVAFFRRAMDFIVQSRKDCLDPHGWRECRGNLQSVGTAKLNGIDPEGSTGRVVAYRGSSDPAHRGAAPVERRRKPVTRNRRSGVNKDATTKVGVGSSSELPHTAELIIDGEITVGTLVPVGCMAIATEGHNTLAMLKRREGETLAQLLTRLDLAIGKAFTRDVFTDEMLRSRNQLLWWSV